MLRFLVTIVVLGSSFAYAQRSCYSMLEGEFSGIPSLKKHFKGVNVGHNYIGEEKNFYIETLNAGRYTKKSCSDGCNADFKKAFTSYVGKIKYCDSSNYTGLVLMPGTITGALESDSTDCRCKGIVKVTIDKGQGYGMNQIPGKQDNSQRETDFIEGKQRPVRDDSDKGQRVNSDV